MNGYPYRRVFISFIFAPALYAILGLLAVFYYEILNLTDGKEFGFCDLFITPFVAGFLAAAVSVFLFLPATVMLAFACSLLKPKKNILGLSICFFLGGFGAYLWWALIYPYRKIGYLDALLYYANTYNGISTFLYGAIFLTIVSLWALPKKKEPMGVRFT